MALYSRKNARRSLLDTVMFRVLSQLSTFAGYAILVRGMSKEDFGVLSVLYALIPFVSTFASLGVEQVLRRYQPEYLKSGRTEAADWLVKFVGSARFVTNAAVLGLIALAWNLLAPLFHLENYRFEFALFCPLILLHFQARVLQLALSSHLLQRYALGMVVVQSVTKLLAYGALFWLHKFTLSNAIIVDTVGYALMYAGLRFGYDRHCRAQAKGVGFKLEREERQRLLKYGFFNNFNDAGTMVLSVKSDNFFISAFLSPVAAGAYAFYTRLDEMVASVLPVRQFAGVIQPFFFAVRPEDAEERLPRYFTFLLNTNLMFQLPILAYVTAYHAPIVQLIGGGKFIEVSWLLPLVVGFSTLNVIADPCTLIAQHRERASIILLSKIFAIYNVVSILILIPMAGLYGAAISSGSAAFFKNLFIWWHVRKTARWTNLPIVLAMTVAIWGTAVALCMTLMATTSLPMVAQLGIGALITGFGAWLYARSPAVAPSDRALLASLLHGREGKLLRMAGIVRPADAQAAVI